MKKLIFAFGIAACLTLSGCYDGNQALKDAQKVESSDEGRFAIANGNETEYTNDYAIIVDTETGVQYVSICYGRNYAVAFPLYNADGTISRIEE